MKTGNTGASDQSHKHRIRPQWSPAMKTGNTMSLTLRGLAVARPQWSPAMKTGNTRSGLPRRHRASRLNGARP